MLSKIRLDRISFSSLTLYYRACSLFYRVFYRSWILIPFSSSYLEKFRTPSWVSELKLSAWAAKNEFILLTLSCIVLTCCSFISWLAYWLFIIFSLNLISSFKLYSCFYFSRACLSRMSCLIISRYFSLFKIYLMRSLFICFEINWYPTEYESPILFVFCCCTSETLEESMLLFSAWCKVPLFLNYKLWPTFSLASLMAACRLLLL